MAVVIGRTNERERLHRSIGAARGGSPQLVVLLGRRRVGKTFLLRHVLDEIAPTPSLYIAALRGRPRQEVARFAREVETFTGQATDATWSAIFAALVDHARTVPTIVAIDEAPYLVDDDPTWTSALQHAWDNAQRNGPCHLFLCLTGSAVTTITSVISSGGPLFGRTTDRIRLDPFDLPMTHELLGASDPVRTVEAFGACGGYPLLLRQWDTKASTGDNLERLVEDPLAPLAVDANALLLDLPDPTGYRGVLAAIGRKAEKTSEIASHMANYEGSSRSEINEILSQRADRALGVLETTGLIRRSHPLDEPNHKMLRYQLADPYLAFWFRFVDPNQQAIDAGQGRQVIRRVLATGWQNHLGVIFEEQARAHAVRMIDRGELPNGVVGKWWTAKPQQADVDLVVRDKRWDVVGEAKWTNRFGDREMKAFKNNLEIAGDRARWARPVVWCKGVVDESLRNAGLLVFGPEEMTT